MEQDLHGLALADAAELPRLTDAWMRIFVKDAAAPTQSRRVRKFADNAAYRLEDISRRLRDGMYEPGSLHAVEIVSGRGKTRKIYIPSVEDRIVERSIVGLMQKHLDCHWSPWSFAYRPGSSVRQAIAAVAQLRDAGATHVLLSDVQDCFQSVDRRRVEEHLSRMIGDSGLLRLIVTLMNRRVAGKLAKQPPGVPQGTPLAPLLANIFLDDLDMAVSRHGLTMVRYADDVLVSADSHRAASRAWTILEVETAAMNMTLNPDKTRVMSFKEGFTFLGQEFEGSRPQAEDELRASGRQTLYLGSQGSYARIRAGRLTVSHGDVELLSVPQSLVGRIVVFGPVGLTAGVRQWAMYSNVDFVSLSARGRFLGSFSGHGMGSVRRRMLQYQLASDHVFSVGLARQLIAGKIANTRALLQRYGSAHPDRVRGPLCQLDAAHRSLTGAESRSEILGFEGSSASAYWTAFSALLPKGTGFTGREYRPAPDPVNAALSLGYALLTGEAVGALAAAGLDPASGFLHQNRDGRASLALDLIEEFRPLVVDTVVLELARRNMFREDLYFKGSGGAVQFTQKGLRMMFGRFEHRMLTVFSHTPSRTRCSYRFALHRQAQALARCVESSKYAYEPVGWRA